MHRFIATVVATLHFDDEDRPPISSEEAEIEFEADSEDPEAAWEEFLESSSLAMVRFPAGVDPHDASIVEEQWEHRSLRRC